MTDLLECTECGHQTFYDKHWCPDCAHETFRTRDPGVGTLRAITMVHITPDGLPAPLALGIARFDNARVIAQLDDDLSVGASVRLEDGFELRECIGEQVHGSRLVAVD